MKRIVNVMALLSLPVLMYGQAIGELTGNGNVASLDTVKVTEWKGNIGGLDTWTFASEDEEESVPTAPTPVPHEAAPATLPSVSVLQERLAFLPSELAVPYNDILEEQIVDYIVNHRVQLLRILGKYLAEEGEMRSIFHAFGVPEDLTALCIVESALNPRALSSAGAAGLWQIMPETAVAYGLECSAYVDERYDPVVATRTAARYLKAAYQRWGSWPLAISSYNCGPGNVEKAVLKAGSLDYWDIYQYLPKETRGYMPAFLAALYTIYFHTLHGMEPIRYYKTATRTIYVNQRTTLAAIAKDCETTQKQIQDLNPQFMLGVIPADRTYNVRIPAAKYTTFKKKTAQPKR